MTVSCAWWSLSSRKTMMWGRGVKTTVIDTVYYYSLAIITGSRQPVNPHERDRSCPRIVGRWRGRDDAETQRIVFKWALCRVGAIRESPLRQGSGGRWFWVGGPSTPFDRLRTGFDKLRAGSAQNRGLGVVDGGWGAEAEDAVFVEVESVSEDPQVPHATGEHDDLVFGLG